MDGLIWLGVDTVFTMVLVFMGNMNFDDHGIDIYPIEQKGCLGGRNYRLLYASIGLFIVYKDSYMTQNGERLGTKMTFIKNYKRSNKKSFLVGFYFMYRQIVMTLVLAFW